jgi:hypothetical protein
MPATRAELVGWIDEVTRQLQALRLGEPGVRMPFPPVWADGTVATLEELTRAYEEWVIDRYQQQSAQQKVPERRARAFLRRFLSREQREQLRRTALYFDEIAPSGRRYRFYPYGLTHVSVLRQHRGGRWLAAYRLCIHADLQLGLPWADHRVAQLLLLREDEAQFLATANISLANEELWGGRWAREVAASGELPLREHPEEQIEAEAEDDREEQDSAQRVGQAMDQLLALFDLAQVSGEVYESMEAQG